MTIKTVAMSRIYLLRHSQEISFEDELVFHCKDKSAPAYSKTKNFLPFICNDRVKRANGRLPNANQLDESMQTPIILCGKEHISFLMFREFHNHNSSTGLDHCRFPVQQTENVVFVISLCSTLRTKINRCSDCRRSNAVAMQPQVAPQPAFKIPNTEMLIFKTEVQILLVHSQ